MDFCRSKLKLPLLVAATGAMIFSAHAQSGGQSIIFSTPQNADSSASTPSLAPQPPGQPDFADQQPSASKSLFNSGTALPSPPPPQTLSPAGQERLRQMQDQKNWSLMTPEEIFGVAAPETDADGREKNPNQVERFLERQNRPQGGATNGGPDSSWNFSRDRSGRADANWFSPGANDLENPPSDLGRFLNGGTDAKTAANQNNNSGWNALVAAQPQTPVKPDLAQQAAMERFRQLLTPSVAADPAAAPSSGGFFPAPKIAIDPNFTPPAFVPNPAGGSFTPLDSGIGKAAGLTPLPGIVAPVNSQPAAVPSWAPQPPPWLSQGPQPFTIPQRKF